MGLNDPQAISFTFVGVDILSAVTIPTLANNAVGLNIACTSRRYILA